MRVTRIHAPGDIRLEEAPEPTITAPTDAIVRVAAACICGSDLWRYRGIGDVNAHVPIGHEIVGYVEAVGDEVTSFRPGDFVVVPFDTCDNTCPHCRAGAQSACVNYGVITGGQGEYALVSQAEGSMVKTPEAPAAGQLAALLSLSDVMATGWHAAVASGVREGGTVAVVGDGAVGLCGVLAARELGAERIIAMSRHESRQQVATAFGATDIVAERGEDGWAAVKELTGGIGADAVLECVGTDDSLETAFRVARPGSTVGFVGIPHGAPPVSVMFRKNIGLAGGVAPVRRYLPDLVERVLDGRLDPSPIFDLRLPLDEVAEGYRAMDERRAIKVFLEI